MKKQKLSLLVCLCSALFFVACSRERAPLGTPDNPVKLFFIPSVDAKAVQSSTKDVKAFFEKATGYSVHVSVPNSYIAVVEAFGTKRADVASINTFGYVLAHEKYGTEALLLAKRHGSDTYRSQIVVRADSGINSLEGLAGKKMAFVDPSSTSGYLLPLKTLRSKNIKPKETVFAGQHVNVITMVYQKQVDAGATFYSPPSNGRVEDARRLALTQFPDVVDKIKILQLSDPIPNDPIAFRKGMSAEMKEKFIVAFLAYVKTEKGAKFFDLYNITGFVRSSDKDYEPVRQMLRVLGTSALELMKKKN